MRTDRKQVNIIYDGLDVNCEITSIDPLDQVFYAGSNTYIPNRSLTPLVLMPKLEIMNSSGAKVATAFTKTSWYFGEIKESTLITSKVSTDDYYIDGLNLVVKKNLDNPVQISFLGEFIDKRTKKVIQVPRVVELSVLSTSEIAPAPTIGIDRPADWAFNPIRDSNIQTLTASVFVNEKAYASAAHWLVEHNGKKEAIDLYDCYVSGQHSHQLIVDTDKLPSGALIWAENLSEEFYNKVYGINPEWDGRMKEVFENRNYFTPESLVSGWYDGKDGVFNNTSKADFAMRDFINISNDFKFIVLTIYKDIDIPRGVMNSVVFYDKDRVFIRGMNPDYGTNGKKAQYEIDIPSNAVYFRYSVISKDAKIKISLHKEKSNKEVYYTPAPEDLNFRNLITNGDFRNGTKGWGANASTHQIVNGVLVSIPNTLTSSNTYGSYKGVISNVGDKIYTYAEIMSTANTKVRVGTDSPSKLPINVERNKWIIVSGVGTTLDTPSSKNIVVYYTSLNWTSNDRFNIKRASSINLTQTFGKGNEPTKEQLDAVFENMPYIESPEDYAPDGILPGTYSTNVPFFVKYPALKVSVADFGDLLESDPSHKLEAEVIYNKGRLDNPSKYIDNQFIIGYANDREEVVGTGNSVVVPAAKFQGAKYVDMEWDFKKRPLTLTEYKQTKLIEE